MHTKTRILFALLTFAPLASLAQAPANDLCTGAEVLTFNSNGLASSNTVTAAAAASATVEAPMTCATGAKNSVWFTFTAPVTGTYGFDTCGTATYTNAIAVYTGTCASLTQVAGACVTSTSTGSSCTPGARLSTNNLDAGMGAGTQLIGGTTYYVQVAASLASVTFNAASQLALRVGVEGAVENDSCSGTLPDLTLTSPIFVSTRAANTLLATDDAQLPTDGGCYQLDASPNTSVSAAAGQDVAVRFTPPTTGQYSFRANRATVTTPDVVMYLTKTCSTAPGVTLYEGGAGGQCVAAVNRGLQGASTTEELSCVTLAGGDTQTLWIDSTVSGTGGAYQVEVAACTPEKTSNDTIAQAGPLSCPITGTYAPLNDVDYFAIGTYPGAKLFAMTELNAAGSAYGDSELRVTTATDTLFFDQDDATLEMGASASVIAGVTLPAQPAYLRTNYNNGAAVAGPYRLHTMLKFDAPLPEVEPNDTRVQATLLTSYASGTVSSTADVDIYAFQAKAGDLVFLALDGAPLRGGVPSGNHNLDVYDALGWRVGTGNDTNTANNNTASPGTLIGTTPTAPAEAYVFRANTTGLHYVHVSRVSAAGTGEYELALSIDCGMIQPTLTSVIGADGGVPAEGTVLGGDTLTLEGTGFDPSSQVRIDGADAVVIARTPTSLTVTTPGGNAGLVDVQVTNFGNLKSTLPGSFLYVAPVAPPTVLNVSPDFGPLGGGTLVTLSGTLFKPGAEVSFTAGATTAQCTSINVVNASQLTCVTPALIAGAATITVRNPVDDLSGSLADAFTYVPAPTFASVTPATGLTLGGQSVTVTGTGFLPGIDVRFGPVSASNIVVAGDGLSLTATTPAAANSGVVSLTLRNADGQQVVASAAFTYVYPPPTFATITPATGLMSGGQLVTITGWGFLSAPAPTVTFGGVPARGVSRLSGTSLSVLTPAGSGTVDVVIGNNDGQSVTATGVFTFVSAPTVSSISPTRGPVQGGTRVTITGQNFANGARVTIGGVPAFAPSVVDAQTITAVTNAGAVGLADVRVENPDTQSAVLTGAFTYDAAPSLASLAPGSGTIAGGTVVTLTGVGFRAGATVHFGATLATPVTVVSSSVITASTPAGALGVVAVRVTNDDGQWTELPRAFRYVAPPTLTDVAPAAGDVAGGTVVRLTGTHFASASTVLFDGQPASRTSLISPDELEAVSPPHAPGAVDVSVVNANGDTVSLSAAFTYVRAAPTLVMMAPSSALISGGAMVNLTGTGFSSTTTVSFGGVAALSVVAASSELLRVVAPAHAAGTVQLVVSNDDGQSASLDGFTFVAPVEDEANAVTDGGTGGLMGAAPDAGGEPTMPTGCGCSGVEGSALVFVAALLLRRRRR